MSKEQENDQVHIVFYSKFDDTSQIIKKKLKNELNVRTLCVDNKTVNKSILSDTNYNVTCVPTILTINQNGQDSLTQGDHACNQFILKLNKKKLQSMEKPSIFDTRLKMTSSEIAANQSLSTQKEKNDEEEEEHYQEDIHKNESRQSLESTRTLDSVTNKKLSPKELADKMMKERGL